MVQKRGRKSGADLSTVAIVGARQRPEPPNCLNNRAQDEWRRVVSRMPIDWFSDETLSLLQIFCEHVSEGEALQLMIETVRPLAMSCDESFDRYKRLISLKEAQSRAALNATTQMRITQQSGYGPRAADTTKQNAGHAARPWEYS